jgi:hypothetical protein
MRCDLCDDIALFHLTERDKEHITERHLCEVHVRSLDTPPYPSIPLQLLSDHIRTLLAMINSLERLPTVAELQQWGGNNLDSHNPRFAEQLKYLQHQLDFIDRNGRLPEGDENPPCPF